MHEKIKNYQDKIYAFTDQLRDLRVIGLAVFLVIVLLISWSSVKVIETNYDLQRDIARLEQESAVKKLANENLKLQNQYYNTQQYLELTARANFGRAAPGETVLVVPKQVALSRTVALKDTEEAQIVEAQAKQPAYQRNVQAWVDFLLHRGVKED